MTVLFPMTVGFGAGVLAWLLMGPDQDRVSFILTTILGAIAGGAAALIGNAAGWFQIGDVEGLAGAALGAAIALNHLGRIRSPRLPENQIKTLQTEVLTKEAQPTRWWNVISVTGRTVPGHASSRAEFLSENI